MDRTPFRIAIAQINMTVGDLYGNTTKIIDYIDRARQTDADIVTFPELAITGYPPEDLLLKSGFVSKNIECLNKITEAVVGITAVVGFVDYDEYIYNAAAIISGGKIVGVHRKFLLPNYGVFDEERYFQPGISTNVYTLGDMTFGVEVCEDSWYPEGPHRIQAQAGAQVVIAINSSPFHAGKWREREQILAEHAAANRCFFIYGNMVGGQDELVFDGHSLIFGPDGRLICRGPVFEESLIVADFDISETRRKENKANRADNVGKIEILKARSGTPRKPIVNCVSGPPTNVEEIYKALVTGSRDYVHKNGFKRVVLGLSGGIDSALTAVIASDALGADKVIAIVMPSEFSSSETQGDAAKMAERLGIECHIIPICQIFESYKTTLAEAFTGCREDVTEENIQARIRGNILMAMSNKFGWLVLTTGNKSELATGYSTLYGDMAGGFSVIKDVPKTTVYELSRYRNSLGQVIPESIIDRAPSAELKPDQKDEDSLPPYDVLDPIIHAYVEGDKSVAEIVAMGFDKQTVERVVHMIDRNEYKRRQSAPGVKITPKAFGKDRRLPITNKYKE